MSQATLPTIDDLIGKEGADKLRDQVASGQAEVQVFRRTSPGGDVEKLDALAFLNLANQVKAETASSWSKKVSKARWIELRELAVKKLESLKGAPGKEISYLQGELYLKVIDQKIAMAEKEEKTTQSQKKTCDCPKCQVEKMLLEAGVGQSAADQLSREIVPLVWARSEKATVERFEKARESIHQALDAGPIAQRALEKISEAGKGHPLAIMADSALAEMKKVAPELFT